MGDNSPPPPKHKKPLWSLTSDGLYVSGRVLLLTVSTILAGGGVGAFSMFGVGSKQQAEAELAIRRHDADLRAHIVPDVENGVVPVAMSQTATLTRIDDNARRLEMKIDRVWVTMVEFIAADVVKDAFKKNPRLSQIVGNRVRVTVRENLSAVPPRQATAGIENLVE